MTKKLLSILLAVLMVLTFVTPAMAVTKPKKLKSTDVDKMQIRAYASGTETFSPNSEMYSCSPSIKAKGVDYTIGEVEGNEEDGYTTTVTFHFKSGDNFEAAARNVFSTSKNFLAIKEWADHWVGDWEYDFTEERPADQVLTLYWVTNSLGKGSWKIKSTIPGSEYAGNITAAVANLIKVNLKLERTVVYTDGVSGEAFDNQTYTVRNGEATPVFTGTPTREGYNFLGWEPKVAEKVYEDATYTAQWEVKDFTVKYVDGASGEAFEAEEYTVKAGEATPAFQGDLTKYPGWKFKAWTPDLADTVTEDVTYTATWEPKGANTIIYWGNGGTRSKYSVGDTFWSEYTSAAEIKVRGNGFLSFALDEYAFNGWNTKADGTGDSYKSGEMYKFTAAHDLDKANLYAQWVHVACDKHLEDIKVITEPTCTEAGPKLCRCTVCGKAMEVELPALGHDHRGNWTWNREEHWKKCLRCDAIIDCEEHTYGDWKPVVDEKGKDTDREERSCTVCGFTQYSQTLHIGGNTVTKPTDEQNPNTGAQVPSLLPALAVLAGAAILLGKRK